MQDRRGEEKLFSKRALNLLGSKADGVEPKTKKAGLIIGSLAGA
jgi:hypothetical protein